MGVYGCFGKLRGFLVDIKSPTAWGSVLGSLILGNSNIPNVAVIWYISN